MVPVKSKGDSGAKAFLVSPCKVVFVEVEVRPVVADGGLQGVNRLEDAVAGVTRDGLHRNGVMACAEAVAAMRFDVFVSNGILAGVVRVAVRNSKIQRRAVVVPGDEEFFFLFRV